MTIDEMVSVLRAAKHGEQIEVRKRGYMGWSLLGIPSWDFSTFEYRVKREPRVIYVVENDYGGGVVGVTYNPPDESNQSFRKIKFIEVIE